MDTLRVDMSGAVAGRRRFLVRWTSEVWLMAKKWVDVLEDLGRRAKNWLAELESKLNPDEPELIPVPVRPTRPRGDRRR